MISGPPLSGQPGKAVGHAGGKLTRRHDLGTVAPERYAQVSSSAVNSSCSASVIVSS